MVVVAQRKEEEEEEKHIVSRILKLREMLQSLCSLCHICLLVCLRIMDSHSKAAKKPIQAMEMRCYCKIQRISYKDHMSYQRGCPCQSDHTKTVKY